MHIYCRRCTRVTHPNDDADLSIQLGDRTLSQGLCEAHGGSAASSSAAFTLLLAAGQGSPVTDRRTADLIADHSPTCRKVPHTQGRKDCRKLSSASSTPEASYVRLCAEKFGELGFVGCC